MSSHPNLPSRNYENVQDLIHMQAMLMDGRKRTTEWHYAHVGELMWDFFMVTCHLDPHEHIRLWHDASGKLVAYAILGEDPAFNCQVSPDYEWQGIEGEALQWAESRIGELRKTDAERWGGDLVSGARQDSIKKRAFLEEHGFQYLGRFSEVNMLRSLEEPIPTAPIPAGFLVREVAEIGEISNRAGAERDVWLPWTVGNITGEDYSRLMQLPGYQRELDVVSVAPDGTIAAYVNCWMDPVNRIGDFGPVGARPPFRRQGLTRLVLLEGLRWLKASGMERVCVSTTHTNISARRLYESIGFNIVNKYLDYTKASGLIALGR